LNAYLGARKTIDGPVLCAQTVSDFLKDYPVRARNRGSLKKHVAGVKTSVYRLVDYLHLLNRFEPHVKLAVYNLFWRRTWIGWSSTNTPPRERLSVAPRASANFCDG
jgi:hypothetical protein